jgi:mannose-6-phosphate isomerase-like protein (cupin superfamily)
MPESIEVLDVNGGRSTVQVSNFGGFPDEGICGYRDEWQPGILHVVSFHNSKPHYHDDKEEIFLILEGSGKIILGGVEVAVSKWDTVLVPRYVEHMGVPNPGDELVVAVFFIDQSGERTDPEESAKITGKASNG